MQGSEIEIVAKIFVSMTSVRRRRNPVNMETMLISSDQDVNIALLMDDIICKIGKHMCIYTYASFTQE